MHKVRILFISHSSFLDGAEISLLYILSYLNRDKYEAFVILPSDGPLKKRIEHLGWETIILNFPWWIARRRRRLRHFIMIFGGMFRRVRILCDVIRNKKIEIVYTNTITVIDGAIAARLTGVHHIWHIREILSKHISLKSYFPNFIMPFIVDLVSDRVIVPSNATRRDIESRINQHKIRVINNGIEINRFSSVTPGYCAELRDKLGISEDTKIVALVGAFLEIKGQADFIEAAKIVSNKVKDSAFLLVGNDNNLYGNFVKKKVHELQLDNKVHFLGFRHDVEKIISCINVLVSASWVDSFPKVICEAMAAAKPIVATRCGGPEEIVIDGNNGILVPTRDIDRLAQAIIRLLTNDEEAKKMGIMGKKRAEELYTIERCVRKIEGVLDEIC